MAIITSLATLKTAVADTLNRSDLSSATGGNIEIWIQLAEQRFQRDPRIRQPSSNAVLVSLMTTDPNWLLTAEPDIYLYATLVESAPYLKDDERIAVWEQRYQDAAEALSGSVRLDPARTLALTSYAELQTMVADALNRGDMKTVIPVCITMAERNLANDWRVRNLTSATYSITGDDLAVPSGFRKLEAWYYDPVVAGFSGAIKIVGASALGNLKNSYGNTGTPGWAAIIAGAFRFAPAPDTTYSTKMTFWRTLTALASGANWLYTAHPHVYMYASLIECEPWLPDSAAPRVAGWKAKLEEAVEALHLETWDEQFSGSMSESFDPIGG